MAGETPITVVGNLTADPELRFTPSGAAVANFTVASTPRTFDKQSNEWKDGEALFLNCSVWRQAAENAAESLTRGMRVIVQGRLKARSYETREGEKRTVFEIDVDEVGPSVKYATAKVTKTSRSGGGQGFGGGGSGGGDDPWASSGGGNSGGGSGSSSGSAGNGGGWGGNQGGGQGGGQGSGGGQGDPWATSGSGGSSDEPPF
jgi:single-strand DNA-binding protein